MMPAFIKPRWPAPENVLAFSTTRLGGRSQEPFQTMNLAEHVGDAAEDVEYNRELVHRAFPQFNQWQHLVQVHGTEVIQVDEARSPTQADAMVCAKPETALVIATADCLPVVFCDDAGTRVGAAHAGWRGLANGCLEKTVGAMSCPADSLLAWIGPHISASAYQVGPAVRDAFLDVDPSFETFFKRDDDNHWRADLAGIARARLRALGLNRIFDSGHCTWRQHEVFYSYRRANPTGRQWTVIGLLP